MRVRTLALLVAVGLMVAGVGGVQGYSHATSTGGAGGGDAGAAGGGSGMATGGTTAAGGTGATAAGPLFGPFSVTGQEVVGQFVRFRHDPATGVVSNVAVLGGGSTGTGGGAGGATGQTGGANATGDANATGGATGATQASSFVAVWDAVRLDRWSQDTGATGAGAGFLQWCGAGGATATGGAPGGATGATAAGEAQGLFALCGAEALIMAHNEPKAELHYWAREPVTVTLTPSAGISVLAPATAGNVWTITGNGIDGRVVVIGPPATAGAGPGASGGTTSQTGGTAGDGTTGATSGTPVSLGLQRGAQLLFLVRPAGLGAADFDEEVRAIQQGILAGGAIVNVGGGAYHPMDLGVGVVPSATGGAMGGPGAGGTTGGTAGTTGGTAGTTGGTAGTTGGTAGTTGGTAGMTGDNGTGATGGTTGTAGGTAGTAVGAQVEVRTTDHRLADSACPVASGSAGGTTGGTGGTNATGDANATGATGSAGGTTGATAGGCDEAYAIALLIRGATATPASVTVRVDGQTVTRSTSLAGLFADATGGTGATGATATGLLYHAVMEGTALKVVTLVPAGDHGVTVDLAGPPQGGATGGPQSGGATGDPPPRAADQRTPGFEGLAALAAAGVAVLALRRRK